MECILLTYDRDIPVDYTEVFLPDYDGDPHGDTVPFTVGSNQTILLSENFSNETRQEIDNLRDLNCRIGDAAQNTAAMAALDAAREVLSEDPYCCGCPAFHTPASYKSLHHYGVTIDPEALCVILADGGDFAAMLNAAYENYVLINAFKEAMAKRGFECRRLNHFSYAVHRIWKP